MKTFEDIDLSNFPAEECNIKLKVNNNFFKSEKKYMLVIYDKEEDMVIIKNLYACLGEKDGEEIFGFVGDNELEFYSFKNKRYILKAISETCNMELFMEDLKNNFL